MKDHHHFVCSYICERIDEFGKLQLQDDDDEIRTLSHLSRSRVFQAGHVTLGSQQPLCMLESLEKCSEDPAFRQFQARLQTWINRVFFPAEGILPPDGKAVHFVPGTTVSIVTAL